MQEMWAPALPLPEAKMGPLKMTQIMFSRYQLKPTSFERAHLRDHENENARHVGPCITPARSPQSVAPLEIDMNHTF